MTIINNTVSQSFQETWHTQFLSMLKHFQEKLRSKKSFRSLQLKCVSVKMTSTACFSTCYWNTVIPFFTPLIVVTVQCSFSELRLSSWGNHTGHVKCEEKLICIKFVYSKKPPHKKSSPLQDSNYLDLRFCYHLLDWWKAPGWISFPLSFLPASSYLLLSFIIPTPYIFWVMEIESIVLERKSSPFDIHPTWEYNSADYKRMFSYVLFVLH